MRNELRIGRTAGIDICLDWSWLFVLALLTWELASGVFPVLHPQWDTALTWGTALAASLLFFASVLAHELAHSLVAKANGIPVSSINLFLFGGCSNIRREPTSPRAELVMAIAGPLTSLLLGAIFVLVSTALAGGLGGIIGNPSRALARLDPLSTLFLWLGPINILFGLFNLIPGFPLDGGRVLRSILWEANRNLRRATQWAWWVGQFVGWVLIALGISMVLSVSRPYFGAGLVACLWLALIGWLLINTAVQSYRQVMVEDSLAGVPVARLMSTSVRMVPPNIPVSCLMDEYVMGTREHAFPVVDDGRLVGLVCIHDACKVPHDRWDLTEVGEIMTCAGRLATANPGDEASEALDDLAQRDANQLPVMQDGRLVGMLRRRDIVNWLQSHSTLQAKGGKYEYQQ